MKQNRALPASLVDVAETLGVKVAIRLMEEFGGQEVRFPKKPSPDHPIIKALGETDGRALCMFIGGDLVYVPHGRSRKSARSDVLALEAKGLSRSEIARVLGVSQRHVRRSANSKTDDGRQGSLFPDT